jgi:ribosomal protein S18 acetylase RimI-like enzyme
MLGSISLRPTTPEDETFLLTLYASTRESELAVLGWDECLKKAFIDMQFGAQMQQYRMSYPKASNSIVLLNNEAVGRLIVDRDEHELVLVDISLMPEHRGQRIGTHLIKQLLHEAASVAKPVRLHVLQTNPAKHLYQRLGFAVVNNDQLYCEMVAAPGSNKSTAA